ncbi:MAG: hypothetical protein B0D84_03005 [Candidatus Sedimenticola endophacoides]|uniref:Acyl-CoA thioesterase n=1 Tax=Candidatus Sedimenticola endophacoides TaxID=2548426 RepID=A0A657Q1Y4_9GAMM|nr:MAG: hypothetical protein B0D84_03005 [Candidatus Sedimenticola endophacoides]OQX46673.1 MAG: hypothetical protein B0D86_01235 [Candidatus Sedimenticola endophacoides]
MRVLAMPADTNPAGDIFGGWIMSQADAGPHLGTGKVEVFARRDRDPGAEHRIAEASITYVAVDQEGHPRELRAL